MQATVAIRMPMNVCRTAPHLRQTTAVMASVAVLAFASASQSLSVTNMVPVFTPVRLPVSMADVI